MSEILLNAVTGLASGGASIFQAIGGSVCTAAAIAISAGVARKTALELHERNAIQARYENDANRALSRELHAAKIAADWDMFREKSQQEYDLFLQRCRHELELQRTLHDMYRFDATYPFLDGPGFLRRTLASMYAKFPELPCPLVFIQPVLDEGHERLWQNARFQAEGLLGGYHNRGLLHLISPDRCFRWPHPDLYTYDLQGLPTIIVYGKAGVDQLDIWLGGCHILTDDVWGVPRPLHMLTFRYRFWQERDNYQELEALPTAAPAVGDRNPVQITLVAEPSNSSGQDLVVEGRTPRPRAYPHHPAEQEKLHRLTHQVMIDLASKTMALLVVAMMDAYHLMRRERYAEQLDGFLAWQGLSPNHGIALPFVPRELVHDPAYHCLHQARRSLQPNYHREAEEWIVRAFEALWQRFPPQSAWNRTLDEIGKPLDDARSLPPQCHPYLRLAFDVVSKLPPEARLYNTLLPRLHQTLVILREDWGSGVSSWDEKGMTIRDI